MFVLAATTRLQVEFTAARLEIAIPGTTTRLQPRESGFADAMRVPGQLLWMRLDAYGRHPHHWLDEDQLAAARSACLA